MMISAELAYYYKWSPKAVDGLPWLEALVWRHELIKIKQREAALPED